MNKRIKVLLQTTPDITMNRRDISRSQVDHPIRTIHIDWSVIFEDEDIDYRKKLGEYGFK